MAESEAVALTRFGLGAGEGDLERVAAVGARTWLTRQLEQPDPAVAARLANLPSSADRVLARDAMREGAGDEVREEVKAQVKIDQQEHLMVAALSETPFVERLVAFWSNHLAVSMARKEVAPLVSSYEREVVRAHLGGTFAEMLLASAQSPAMLLYLDNVRSVGPGSPMGVKKGRGLNENYARELLELHTLGVDGGYDQDDVLAMAKLLTGWTLDTTGKVGATGVTHPTGRFVFDRERHEPGAQQVVGRGFYDAESALAALAAHPATAQHLATKLARHFVADDPPADAVAVLAAAFRDSGGRLPAVHAALVGLDAAWASPLSKVKTPWELVVSAARALGPERFNGEDLLKSVQRMGQSPYAAPTPQGWPDRAADWMTPGGMLARLGWAAEVGKRSDDVDASRVAQRALGPLMTPETWRAVAGADKPNLAVAAWLMSPEFQRR